MSQPIQHSVQYSFPKSPRFKRIRTPCQTDYYQPNLFKSTRAPAFGYGTKFDFTKTKFYTESYYDPTSSFNLSKGISFGLGRDLVKNQSYVKQKRVPGPGSYDLSPSKAPGYSIGQKLSYFHQPSIEIPGPGAYDPSTTNKRSISINKGPERFLTDSTCIPGPGEYDAKHMKRRTQVRFGSAKRNCFVDDAVKAAEKGCVPGPGNYECVTQFVQIKKNRPSTAKH